MDKAKKTLLIVLFLLIAYSFEQNALGAEEVRTMKRIVMIIAENNFRDEELLQPKEIFGQNGIEVKIASTTLKTAVGTLGVRIQPDTLLEDLEAKDFDAIVFVGGQGSQQYFHDGLAHQLAQEAVKQNKLVAAICIAPVTLANAGLLKGKRATVWSSEADALRAGGAIYTGKDVEKDGKIITASGPLAAREFAKEIVKVIAPGI